MKKFFQHLKSGKPNPQKSRGRVVQPSYVRFSLLKTAVSIEGSKRPFMGISGGKWPTDREVERNYGYEKSVTSWRAGEGEP